MDETTTDGTGTDTDGDTDCKCECPGADTEGSCTQTERGCAVVPSSPPSGLLLALLVMHRVIRRRG